MRAMSADCLRDSPPACLHSVYLACQNCLLHSYYFGFFSPACLHNHYWINDTTELTSSFLLRRASCRSRTARSSSLRSSSSMISFACKREQEAGSQKPKSQKAKNRQKPTPNANVGKR
jgi:hypothetical protein